MIARAYYAETVETQINSLKTDYMNLMNKYMKEDNEEKVLRVGQAIIALGILEDRLFEHETVDVEV